MMRCLGLPWEEISVSSTELFRCRNYPCLQRDQYGILVKRGPFFRVLLLQTCIETTNEIIRRRVQMNWRKHIKTTRVG